MKYEFMGFDEATLKRFWSKVDKRGDDECWEWQGSLTKGYGQFYFNGKASRAHIFSVILHHSDRPLNAFALHACDNRSCVNPSHLRWGTHKDNMEDAVARQRGAHPRRKKTDKTGYVPFVQLSKSTQDFILELNKRASLARTRPR